MESDRHEYTKTSPGLLTSALVMPLATGIGFGYSPFAPGTVGALWGLPLMWAISRISSTPLQALVILVLCLVGIPLCTSASRQLGKKDPKPVVWDEIVSMPITFFLVAPQHLTRPEIVVAGFVLNRIFDILKPSPARNFEKLPDGLGIMADDWIAGVYSCLVLHLLLWSRLLPLTGG